ncbi:MAG: hypothetical protein ACI82F_002208 [Planctomycetota bacterium]|jgi:hypothetical protein
MKVLVPLLCLALLGCVGFLLFAPAGTSPGASGPTAVVPGQQFEVGPETANLVQPEGDLGNPGDQREASAIAAAETGPGLAPLGISQGELRQVVLLRAEDRSPVSGAFVHVQKADDDLDEGRQLRDEDLDLYLSRFTERFASDSAGIARIPADRNGWLCALAPGLVGSGEINRRNADTIELLLYPDRTVAVEVFGPAGPLEEVDVVLGSTSDRRGRGREFARRRTDANGMALFTHASALMRGRRGGAGDQPSMVKLDIPLEEDLTAAVPPLETLESNPDLTHKITLHAPATGAVAVRVFGADGTSFDSPGSVQLVQFGEELNERLQALDNDIQELVRRARNSVVRDLEGGLAHFAHVGLGLELGVRASFEEERDPTAELKGGPLVGGSLVEIDLTAGPVATVLIGRLVDEAGEPLANLSFSADSRSENRSRDWREQTDADGFFRLRYEPRQIPETSWSLSVRPRPSEPTPPAVVVEKPGGASSDNIPLLDPAGLEATYESLFAPVPGENDLEDLVCGPRPLLVAGHVIDETGAGVEGIRIRPMVRLRGKDDPSREFVVERSDVFARADQFGTTDEEGVFRIFGRLGDLDAWPDWNTETILRADGTGISSSVDVRFEAGDRDITIQAFISGSIAGSFDVEDESVLRMLDITLRSEDERRPLRLDRRNFRLDNLRPGTWSLVALVRQGREDLVNISGIIVLPGETTEDPRLQNIDLTELQKMRIEVASSTGDSIRRVSLQRRLPHENEWSRSERQDLIENDGVRFFDLVTSQPGLDLRLLASEHRVGNVTNITGDRKITLEPGLAVTLVVERELMELLREGESMAAQLRRDGIAGSTQFGNFSATGTEFTRQVGEEGTYSVRVWLNGARPNTGNRRFRSPVARIALDQEIEVSDGSGTQRVLLRITRENMAAALEQLRQL